MTEPGIYYDMSDAEYAAIRDGEWPALNQTLANEILNSSPMHVHARFRGWTDHEDTKSTIRGNLIHKLILGRGASVQRIDAADYRTKRAQQERDAALEIGRLPVLEGEYADAETAARLVSDQLASRGISLTGASELVAVWRADGVLCKGRLDHWISDNGLIVDLKSTRDASLAACARSCITYGYDVQRVAYIEGLTTVMPALAGRVDYAWVFIESKPPYAVAVRRARGTMRQRGESRWRRAVSLWKQCCESGVWNGYEDGDVDAPPWAMEEGMEYAEG